MKRIFALLSVCAFALSFSACRKTEPSEGSSYYAQEVAKLEASEGASDEEVGIPDNFSENSPANSLEPASGSAADTEFIADIHEWAEDNVLYNINNTYELTERYYLPFKRVEGTAALWYGAGNVPALNEIYDPYKAVSFAKAHWDDGEDVCAPFISRCLKAGELSIGSDSSTALCFKLLNSRLGFGQFLPMNDDKTVTLPEYAAPGDIVQLYCSYEGLMIHSMIVVGKDESGHMKVCCHNPENSGEDAFCYEKLCNSCLSPLREVFFFHFYGDEDDGAPDIIRENQDLLLYENSGFAIPNQYYNRAHAAEFARSSPIDGIGQFGAEQTSAALAAGGLNVGVPIQTALFMQLMKSRLGAVYSLPINPDRTVTLPKFAKEGDVCFLYCPEEALIYSSFIVNGADADGKMLGCSRDRINDENSAFKVESVCPSSKCNSKINEVLLFHFN